MEQDTNKNNERLKLLMSAVGNDRLDGEACPNCFGLYSTPILSQFSAQIFSPRVLNGRKRHEVQDALSVFTGVKDRCVLRKAPGGDEIVNEWVCEFCKREYLGELDLVANQSEARVLSFFGYDALRIYQKDFYPFSILEDSYGSLVQKLWAETVVNRLTPRKIVNTIEDMITAEVMGQLEEFFEKFVAVIYQDSGASVRAYAAAQAGAIESGRGSKLPPSGADFALWVGPLTPEEVGQIDGYMNNEGGSTLPLKVGNGALFQAKKYPNGVLDKKQVGDLVRYAALTHNGHDYFGIPGKLFMKYSSTPPFVTILPCDFTYSLFDDSTGMQRETIKFTKALSDLSIYATENTLAEFVQAYLSGKAGTPLLLHEVFGIPGPKLIIALPPDPLRSSSPTGQALSGILNDWCAALGETLEQIAHEEDYSMRMTEGRMVIVVDQPVVETTEQVVYEQEYENYS
ncbi:MAG TPA: hypothetical protein VGN90_05370 [Pyrinomonadaceae bacterium]|jgi:hypothetical protein|nr:hypothetical protein [Pyrinomonadaceae bacterium]